MTEISAPVCSRCRLQLLPGALACPRCGALVHASALTQLSNEARWQEQYDPARAILAWEQCLKLLPPDSKQYLGVQTEIARLRAAPPIRLATPEPGALRVAKQETLRVAILKTGGSMLLSIIVYQFNFGWVGALGFVLLILVHEMGHVVANLYYGLKASPPIFIPYVGALINLREAPANARVEAVIGIAGPIAGTLASLICLGLYFATGRDIFVSLSWFGFFMNLFNLLPVPPLDGGRVAAAISPWVWVLGLAGLGWMVFDDFRQQRESSILLIIFIIALPRILKTLKPSGRSGPYYAIGKTAPVVIGAAYLALLAILISLRWYTEHHLPKTGLF